MCNNIPKFKEEKRKRAEGQECIFMFWYIIIMAAYTLFSLDYKPDHYKDTFKKKKVK